MGNVNVWRKRRRASRVTAKKGDVGGRSALVTPDRRRSRGNRLSRALLICRQNPSLPPSLHSDFVLVLLFAQSESPSKIFAMAFLAPRTFTLPSSRLAVRPLSTTRALRNTQDGKPSFGFKSGPAPPRLPKEEQEIFEELQRRSTGAFSTPQVNQSPQVEINVNGSGEELHPDAPKGIKPDFEGEKNPKTGEVGGPKNEPLRWGSGGDWSYGGRVTDF